MRAYVGCAGAACKPSMAMAMRMPPLISGRWRHPPPLPCAPTPYVLVFPVRPLSQDGDRFFRMSEVYLRGNTIKYIRVPDEVRGCTGAGPWGRAAGVRGEAGKGAALRRWDILSTPPALSRGARWHADEGWGVQEGGWGVPAGIERPHLAGHVGRAAAHARLRRLLCAVVRAGD